MAFLFGGSWAHGTLAGARLSPHPRAYLVHLSPVFIGEKMEVMVEMVPVANAHCIC